MILISALPYAREVVQCSAVQCSTLGVQYRVRTVFETNPMYSQNNLTLCTQPTVTTVRISLYRVLQQCGFHFTRSHRAKLVARVTPQNGLHHDRTHTIKRQLVEHIAEHRTRALGVV